MLASLRRASLPLTATGLVMLGVLALAVIGLLVDSRTVSGAPVWLKPAKFAASIAIYTLTLAWIFTLLEAWPRLRWTIGWLNAAVFFVEMVIICGQAYRGMGSHFNTATPFDSTLFQIMGAAILAQTLSAIAVAVALWRHRFADAALGWALRLGITISIVGASIGGMMTAPTRDQLAAARTGARMTIAGAHTVGAPDGGPGLAGTGWSTTHGDLRVPHFIGLHAIQALPLVALVLARRRFREQVRVRLVWIGAASYAAVFAILLAQALRGQAVVSPDRTTLALLAAWLCATATAVYATGATRDPDSMVAGRSIA